ncbi:twin-arginine translocation signal domain-containing protein [Halalkaliarchaeum sp. AArc-GB]|uniref:twin-arginine translocation signal domain-containing protein n=1 Tax=Halalkaliarchaeum sp. AArc-GB TaxID=3074078 RepID=UPI002866ACEB|nr:twin-arginine translocation signal domain-containing protein [Halalkaliarchaeum sp. AArc-GB]MDR5672518.1 twin-arginine translocation signal domain-containing protein [Halalkaliarchaeum sp. AArc-GB]
MSENDHNQNRGFGGTSIDRRKVLKGLGAAGALGVFGTGSAAARGPGGNGPPGQSCECPDGEFLAKYEFDDDECEFVREDGDVVVDITYDPDSDEFNKDGEYCEPNYIEFEADGYVIQGVCAFGGLDTSEDYDEDGLTSFASDLENPGGQEAAISNITFCGAEITEIAVEFPDTVSLSYEDLPLDGSNDYDYNDWVVDVDATFRGIEVDGDALISSIELDLLPKARGAGDTHRWSVVPGDVLGEGTYSLTYDGNGEGEEVDAEFDDETQIHVFNTGDVYPDSVTNALEGDDDGTCIPPAYTATLEFELDDPWEFDPDEPLAEFGEHGVGLFFDPRLENLNPDRDVEFGIGDVRLLAVPTDWMWPYEKVHIATAYDGVTVADEPPGDGDQPIFEDDDWYENPVFGEVFESCRE